MQTLDLEKRQQSQFEKSVSEQGVFPFSEPAGGKIPEQIGCMLFDREGNPLPSSRTNRTRLHAFYHKAYWRPALDGYHVGGATFYIGWKAKDTFRESLIQTMRSDKEIEEDPYRFSPSHMFSDKTKLESRVTSHKQTKDTYISVASFWGNATSRTMDYVREVDRFVIDIDGPEHRVLTSKEKRRISKEIQASLGKADFVVDSGCGIQMHFLFERRQDIYAIQAAYNHIVERMCATAESAISLAGCSVDRLWMNSYYRLPGTFNTRSMSIAKVTEYNDLKRLSFAELALKFGVEAIHPYVKKEAVKREKTASVEGTGKRYNSYYSQLEHDYRLIAQACGNEGRRNNLLYYFCYNAQCAIKDPKALQAKAEALNALFSHPLPPSEVRETVQSAIREHEKHGRTFSFESQLEKIGLTAADVGELDIWSPLTDDDRQERRKEAARKQNAKRKAKRREAKQEIVNEVLQMHSDGLSNVEIMRRTGLSRNTVAKYVEGAKSAVLGELKGCSKNDYSNTGRVVAEGVGDGTATFNVIQDPEAPWSNVESLMSNVPFHFLS